LADTALEMEPANKKEISIDIDIPENALVYADSTMLGSIIRNLTGNAVKFTPKGGRIIIGAEADSEDWLKIFIKDTGIGMKKELLENLFKPDYNINRPGTANELSTGLGLAICKDFIEMHGGRFWAESEEGKGSTMNFTLPCKRKYIL
jgi:signal transduction histidine kinase